MPVSRPYPDWYYESTDPNDLCYPGIGEKVRSLVYLLRNAGWNTTSSCGHEHEGVIVIGCYGEQSGAHLASGGVANGLRDFLWSEGYEDFEVRHHERSVGGLIVEEYLTLVMLAVKVVEGK